MVDSFDVVVDGDFDARVRLLDRVWLRVLVVAKVRLSGLGRADVHLCCEWADNLQCGKHVECADVRVTLSSETGYGTVGQGIIKAAGKTRPIRATRVKTDLSDRSDCWRKPCPSNGLEYQDGRVKGDWVRGC
jgi:hypothetical protein